MAMTGRRHDFDSAATVIVMVAAVTVASSAQSGAVVGAQPGGVVSAAPSVFGSRAHEATRALISGTSRAVTTMDMAEFLCGSQ